MTSKRTLTFSAPNEKLRKLCDALGLPYSQAASFSLPAGWTCPSASICLAKADRKTGEITDGPDATVRCYAASLEAAFPAVREMVWRNLEALKGLGREAMADLIAKYLPEVKVLRIHTHGDFFSEPYLRA